MVALGWAEHRMILFFTRKKGEIMDEVVDFVLQLADYMELMQIL